MTMDLTKLFLFIVIAICPMVFGDSYTPDRIPFMKDGKWGFYNIDMRVVIQPKYDSVEFFEDGIAEVCLKKKYGYVNTEGVEVIPAKYSFVVHSDPGLVKAELHSKTGCFDLSGNIAIPFDFEYLGGFTPEELAVAGKNGKKGYIDRTGKFVIPPRYKNAEKFKNGWAMVGMSGKYAYIDVSGKLLTDFSYDYYDHLATNGLIRIFSGKKFGMMDHAGNIVIFARYDDIDPLNCSMFMVCSNLKEDLFGNNGIWAFFDATGKQKTPFVYKRDYLDNEGFHDGLCRVSRDGYSGFIDTNGREVIPCSYEYANEFNDGLAGVCLSNKWGIIDRTGKFIIPMKYEMTGGGFHDGLLDAKLNGKWGFIDKNDHIVIPFKFEAVAYRFVEGFAPYKENKKTGYIDRSGKVVIKPAYDEVAFFSNGAARVKNNGKHGLIDKSGKEIIPCLFDEIVRLNEEEYFVRIDKSIGLYQPGRPVRMLDVDDIWMRNDLQRTYIMGIRKSKGFIGLDGTEYFISTE